MTKKSDKKASNVAGRNTRLLLIETGERLFAQYGVDAVALRDIGLEAGQKNTAVIHYHFGTREGLIRAIFDERIPVLRQRRQELFDHVAMTTRAGSAARLEGILWAYILPLAEQCGSNHFVGFIARLNTDFGNAEHLITRATMQEAEWFRNTLRMELPDLREPHFEIRVTCTLLLILHALAGRQMLENSSRPFAGDLTLDDWVEELVNMSLALIKSQTGTGKGTNLRRTIGLTDGDDSDTVVRLKPATSRSRKVGSASQKG